MWSTESISEQLQAYLDQGFHPAEAVGKLDLVTETVPFWKLEKNWYKLDREDAARLYLYRSLTASKDYAIEEELKDGVAEHLGLNDTVTENTIERISKEVEKQLGGEVRTEVREVQRNWRTTTRSSRCRNPQPTGAESRRSWSSRARCGRERTSISSWTGTSHGSRTPSGSCSS